MRRLDGRAVWTGAFVLWLCVIWGHSLMSAPTSSGESSFVVVLLRPLFHAMGLFDEDLATTIVRKVAHFSEYLMLGVIATKMARAWRTDDRDAWRLLVAIWVAVPCMDEAIQFFVPGRDCRFTDVLIDMAGCALGMLIVRHFTLRR